MVRLSLCRGDTPAMSDRGKIVARLLRKAIGAHRASQLPDYRFLCGSLAFLTKVRGAAVRPPPRILAAAIPRRRYYSTLFCCFLLLSVAFLCNVRKKVLTKKIYYDIIYPADGIRRNKSNIRQSRREAVTQSLGTLQKRSQPGCNPVFTVAAGHFCFSGERRAP